MRAQAGLTVLLMVLGGSALGGQTPAARDFDPATLMWYRGPVQDWRDALPVGNGRLGAMYFGGIGQDRLQFNEETYWTGGPYDSVPKGAYKHLDEVRKLLFDNRLVEGHLLFGRYFLGYPVEQQKYQCMGNVILQFGDKGDATDYRRTLDLTTGIARVTYRRDGVNYVREVFSSHPDQAIVMRIAADQKGKVGFECQLQGVRNEAHSNYATDYFHMDLLGNDGLLLSGKSADYLGVAGKLRYDARLKARTTGGKVWTEGKSLHVEGADEVVLVLVAATNFKSYKDISGNCTARAQADMERVEKRTYTQMEQDHIRDHQALFGRVKLDLGVGENSYLPTDERLKKVAQTPDPALAALAFQFGRYLMIASSRPGTQPANLQGIWNDSANPKWDSKYTTNINLEMNYWSVDSSNLSECAGPLFDLMRNLTDQGHRTARELYGVKRGWVFHQNTDIWCQTTPMDGSNWGGFTVGGAWLCTHIWEHYQYTGDKTFLRQNYPIMKGAAEFFLDFLTPHPRDGFLVTCPGTSPENPPLAPTNHRFFDEMNGGYYNGTQMCYATAIDTEILMDLFDEVAKAAQVLGRDAAFREQVLQTRKKLAPLKVGANGALQEWYEDWQPGERRHRHTSHLYGLYPGNVMSPVKTPELVEPMKKVLAERGDGIGDGSAGWARVWRAAMWARLGDGEHARKILVGCLNEQCFQSLFGNCSNAMQVDGSFGLSAAVTEMLLQSHEGYIELLPALPQAWSKGQFSGVVARGAFELDYAWDGGQLTHLTILSKVGNVCQIKCPRGISVTMDGKKVEADSSGNGVYSFKTQAGKKYQIVMNS